MTSHSFIPTLSTPRPQSSILSSSFFTPSHSYGQVFVSSLHLKRSQSKAANMNLRAMGGAPKFKGTQMREKHLTEMIEKKVMEAKEVCQGDNNSDECKVAWDEVEEVSQAKADFRLKLEKQDPLEYFCQNNPETDECRIYED